jgi:hypothetical protein
MDESITSFSSTYLMAQMLSISCEYPVSRLQEVSALAPF